MSRKLLIASVAVMVLAVAGGALGVARWRDGGSAPPVPGEAARLYQSAEARRTGTDAQIETLQSRLTRGKPDAYTLALLGGAYLQKARETSNPAFYGKAEQALKRSLELEPENGEALTQMGHLALARHQFTDALSWGERAVKANPARAANYGVIGDAQVELGRYDQAVETIQKMVDTRPDLASYSRVSYLRELYGRMDGAIEAMKRASDAGGVPENVSYVRVQLGNLYFNTGRLDEAEYWYNFTLARNPGYGPAQAGLAYVAAARGDDAAAIDLMTRASEASPLPEYVIALGDLYARAGRSDEAARQYDLVRALQRLFEANGTDVDVELALFEADHGTDLARAASRARQGYERRPSIHAAGALAWTLFKAGKPQEAEQYAKESLRLGTKDALKLYHAGMIARALGKTDEARAHLQQALDLNPNFSLLHAREARETLTTLGGTAPQNTARNP
jgi:tetratricopeptide (TPR) repeat protein